MTTLDARTRATSQTTKTETATEPAAVITEQHVLFASAAVLAPARHRSIVHEFTSAVRAVFTRPEKPYAVKHYPQRLEYLESSAMSREMARL